MSCGRYRSFTLIFLLIVFTSTVSLLTGCGKEKTDLYKKGKELIINEKTFDEGVKTLFEFESKNPKDARVPEVLLAIATAYQSRGKIKESIDVLDKLNKNHPGTPEAYKGMFLMGYMYLEEIKDTEKAKTVLTDFIKTYPDSELTASAKVLLDNVGLPIESWSVIKDIDKKQTGEGK